MDGSRQILIEMKRRCRGGTVRMKEGYRTPQSKLTPFRQPLNFFLLNISNIRTTIGKISTAYPYMVLTEKTP